MSDPYPQSTPAPRVGAEVERDSFRAGAVVQLVAGDPSDGDATVVEVHPATVVVTSERLLAVDGDLEWSWLLADIEAVHHGRSEPWTIVEVPGVGDHGVSVPVSDVLTFRRTLAAALAGGATPVLTPAPSAAPLPVEEIAPKEGSSSEVDEPTGAGAADPLVEAHAIAHHAPIPDVHADDDLRPHTDPDGGEVDDPHSGQGGLVAGAAAATAAAGIVTVADLHGAEVATVDLTDATSVADPVEVGEAPTTARGRGWRGRRGAGAVTVEPEALAGLEAREISAWFGTHHVLDRVSLVMEPGEVTALIGPSGCGKSTFLRILNRMHEMIPIASLSGEVLLDGDDIYDPQKKLTEARRQIGMVFQKPNPFPAMSIYDNVVASYRLTGTKISSDEKDQVVEACLTKAGLWTEVRDRLRAPGGGLSGGQQQRLCIARALAIRPRVLLMDEPCSALDPTSTRRIEETIMELGSEVTIVIVTHNMQQAARVSDQCAFFLAEQGTPGVIVEHGPTDAMFQSPQDPRTFDYVNGRFG
jgi:phosphate transport system ATP-binding protein